MLAEVKGKAVRVIVTVGSECISTINISNEEGKCFGDTGVIHVIVANETHGNEEKEIECNGTTANGSMSAKRMIDEDTSNGHTTTDFITKRDFSINRDCIEGNGKSDEHRTSPKRATDLKIKRDFAQRSSRRASPTTQEKNFNASLAAEIDEDAVAPTTRRPRRTSSEKNSSGSQYSTYTPIYEDIEKTTPMSSPIDANDIDILASIDKCAEHITKLHDVNVCYSLLFPAAFPWHNPPQELAPILPRDIDNHPGVVFADHDYNTSLPETATEGKRGFRRILHWDNAKMNCGYPYAAAARRAETPGVMDLHLNMTFHQEKQISMIERSLPVNSWEMKRKNLFDLGERAEIASCMPWHWSGKYDFADKIQNVENEKCIFDMSSCEDYNDIYKGMIQEEQEKSKHDDRQNYWYRNWKVSVKVSGVSSRGRILNNPKKDMIENSSNNIVNSRRERQNLKNITQSQNIANEQKSKLQIESSKQNSSKRPRLTNALFPAFVQSGRSMLTAKAASMDEEGLSSYLGSYDCRFAAVTNNDKNPTKAKRVNVGRTRLMWTSIDVGNDTYSKKNNTYTSILTGAKLDSSTFYKRPRLVDVAIKVNGEQIMEETKESKSDQTVAIQKQNGKGKNGKMKVKSNDSENKKNSNKPRLKISLKNLNQSKKQIPAISSTSNRIPLHENNAFNALCTYDRSSYLDKLRLTGRSNTKKKSFEQAESLEISPESAASSQIITMKYGTTSSLKYKEPIYSLLPLDDGYLRTVCQSTGSMNGCGIHSILNQASRKQNGERVCSICWTPDSTNASLRECVDCGLLVHLSCCKDKGEISRGDEYDILASDPHLPIEVEKWRCSVCVHYKNNNKMGSKDEKNVHNSVEAPKRKKARRASKMPSRYLSKSYNQVSISTKIKANHKYRPSFKCSLCPHSGGAMSPACAFDDSVNFQCQKWTHEVCRIWNTRPQHDNVEPYLPDICAICGECNPSNISHQVESPQHLESKEKKSRSNFLVKCAAKGCMVAFHPFCAMLVSKCRSDENNRESNYASRSETTSTHEAIFGNEASSVLAKKLKDDYSLSKQYTLQLLELSRLEGSNGTFPGEKKKSVVPVAFCGIHNPKRHPSLYGYIPEDFSFASSMRIPLAQEIENN